VGALDLGALGEQRVGLVEEQHRVGVLGLVEDPGQVLLGLADQIGPGEAGLDPPRHRAQAVLQHEAGALAQLGQAQVGIAAQPRLPDRALGGAPDRGAPEGEAGGDRADVVVAGHRGGVDPGQAALPQLDAIAQAGGRQLDLDQLGDGRRQPRRSAVGGDHHRAGDLAQRRRQPLGQPGRQLGQRAGAVAEGDRAAQPGLAGDPRHPLV
jgi:hypothetical protein